MPPFVRPLRHARPAPLPAELCACDMIQRASRALTRLYDSALSDANLSATQLGILHQVASDPPPTFESLATELVLERTSLHHALAPLVRNEWVSVSESRQGRQVSRTLSLTDSGRAAYAVATWRWNKIQQRIVRELGPDRWADVQAAMESLVVACRSIDVRTLD